MSVPKTVSPQLMQRIRQDVQSMHAYAIQDSVGMVKLDAMENPHRLPADLQKALGERLGALALNRYPGERVNELRQALASYAGMPEGFDIMLGNGSDELISLLAMACVSFCARSTVFLDVLPALSNRPNLGRWAGPCFSKP